MDGRLKANINLVAGPINCKSSISEGKRCFQKKAVFTGNASDGGMVLALTMLLVMVLMVMVMMVLMV